MHLPTAANKMFDERLSNEAQADRQKSRMEWLFRNGCRPLT